MTLVYIQQRSYHYVFLCIDGSVFRCLYLNVDGNGLAHADMVRMICIVFMYMYIYCVNETQFKLGLVVF